VPELPRRYVDRPRLTAMLDDLRGNPVTIVCAPPGWGKTVMLGAWAAQHPGGCAWLTLEPGDGSLFWEYVLAALRAAQAVDETQFAATAEAGAGASAADALPDRLAAWSAGPGEPVSLVIDDFHELTDPGVLGQVETLVRHLGERLRLVLGTRADPALPLHRWRLNGVLGEVRGADLSFTLAETGALLAAHEVRISESALADLHGVSEGWAASLRLAALSMAGSPEPERVAAEFATHDRVLSDYLLSEVLDRLPEDFRDVLLRTSVLDEVNPALVAALTDRADGARVLAGLERANALVARRAGPGDWYRYHPLLAQILRSELQRQHADAVGDLQRRAARWYTRNGQPACAIRHALAAGDWSYAVDVLTAHWPDVVPGARRHVLAEPVAAPSDLVRADSRLALAFAADRLDADDGIGASAFVRLADRVLVGGARGGTEPMVLAFRLAAAQVSGDLTRVLATAPQLLADGGEGADGVREQTRALALVALGGARLHLGEPDAAEPLLRDGLALAVEAALDRVQLTAMSQLAVLAAVQGRLHAAERMARRALDLGAAAGQDGGDLVWARLALAEVAHERAEPEEAAYHLNRALDTTGNARPAVLAGTSVMRARLLAAADLPGKACAVLTGAREQLADAGPPPLLDTALDLVEADVRAALAGAAQARQLLTRAARYPWVQPWAAVAGAGLDLAAGRAAAAATATAPLVGGPAEPAPSPLLTVRAALVHARATHRLGDRRRCTRALEAALQAAAAEDFRRPFADAGAEMAGLLTAHLGGPTAHRALAVELADWLAGQAAGGQAGGAAGSGASTQLLEQLTDRELAVLRYLQSMMSNVEIADTMCVSVNTIKTHVKNIYRKLDTGRRRDAVRRARELRLL
jgi:LuxR family maltose regulon positive regulatory protein